MELWTAFVLGLAGSVHCAGMCGPIAVALAQIHPLMPGRTEPGRRFVLSRLMYNLGRVITYGAMGLVFGLMGRVLWMAGLQRALSIALGSVLLLGLGFARFRPAAGFWARVLDGLKKPMAALVRRRSPEALLVLGLLNGLLPCGLVYVAAAGAMATGDALPGAAYMLLFGAGTVPTMLALALSGRWIAQQTRLRLARVVPVTVFLMACLLVLRGLELGIPFLSPVISSSSPTCCHR